MCIRDRVMNLLGEYSELNVRRCLSASCMLSSDVSSAYDPSYASSFDKKNVAYLGGGMVFNLSLIHISQCFP